MSAVDTVVRQVRRTLDRPYVLGVAGAPGAGKSTFVAALARRVEAEHPDVVVSRAPMDGFHLPNRELERRGLRHVKGIPDTFDAAAYAALLQQARAAGRRTITAPEFDRSIEEPVADALPIPPGPGLLLAEGNYLALASGDWPDVRRTIDELWFLDVPLAECAERCRRRRLEHGADPTTAQRLVDTVDAPNGSLVAATRSDADRVLSPAQIATIVGPAAGSEGPPPTRRR